MAGTAGVKTVDVQVAVRVVAELVARVHDLVRDARVSRQPRPDAEHGDQGSVAGEDGEQLARDRRVAGTVKGQRDLIA